MEQFIRCDAQKKFSVFAAVNEKRQAGEALRRDLLWRRDTIGAAPCTGANAGDCLEDSSKVALVCKPAKYRYIGQRERPGS